MRLKDKVAIITGGSRGIGFATTDKFLKEGATVVLTASSQTSADKAVAQLQEKYPEATVAGISPNLSSLDSVRNAFREATEKYGCVDILVNNAGVSESTPFTEYTEETFYTGRSSGSRISVPESSVHRRHPYQGKCQYEEADKRTGACGIQALCEGADGGGQCGQRGTR